VPRKEGVKQADAAAPREHGAGMADVLLLALFTGFFALAVLFVKGCERIVGADAELLAADEAPDTDERVVA
jgi:hypothetical protein